MVIIKPFKATILNPDLSDRKGLICPVYDTIDETEYDRYGRDENNMINITTRRKGTGVREYIERAAGNLERFFADHILKEYERPALYIYGIRYSLPHELKNQIPLTSRRDVYFAFGLVALVKVEELKTGSIAGHERIFEKNTAERYELMKTCRMNFSPVVSEYSMPGHEINNLLEDYLGFKRPDLVLNAEVPPILDLPLKNTRHLLWEISDPQIIGHLQTLMADRKVLILDGHHRYNAANDLRVKDGVEYTMMMFMEGGDRALLLLPWHRCVRRIDSSRLQSQIEQYFDVIWKGKQGDEFNEMLQKKVGNYDVRIGVYERNEYAVIRAHEHKIELLSSRLEETVGLDYISLNEWLIGPCLDGSQPDSVVFVDSAAEAERKVDEQGFDICFIMRPLAIGDVEYKAHVELKNFPQKSTLFLPKVAEGIVMWQFGQHSV